jgi:hypothetical protein
MEGFKNIELSLVYFFPVYLDLFDKIIYLENNVRAHRICLTEC